MAKGKSSKGIEKVTFGKRKTGRAKKSYGPKDSKPKRYRGQGR